MSLWKRVSCNPEIEQRMIQYYNEKRLLDLRIYFAQWIEDKIICDPLTNPTSEQYERTALQFFEDLKQKLLTSVHENLIKYKIAEIYQNIAQTTAVELYTYMRSGLQRESQMLEALSPQSQAAAAAAAGFGGGGVGVGVGVGNNAFMGTSPIMGGGVMPPNCTMHPSGFSSMHSNGEELYPLQARILELYNKLECFRQNLQQFSIDHDHLRNYLAQLNQSLNPPNDLQLERQLALVMNQKNSLCMELRCLYTSHDPIQNAVIDELKNWQRNQAKAGNGAPFHDNLDDIQNCIERLVDILCKMDNAIVQLINLDPHNKAELDDLLKHVRGSQRLLYCSAFIVEKQPPQVMKTNTRFAAAVRWLIGPQLGINLNSPTVECVILSEAQAHRQFVQQRNQENPHNSSQPQSGEILNNCSTMEYQQQTRVFSASFRNMQLKKIKRAEKKGTESVMDEKFALLFSTSTVVNDILLRVWTLSLPVVVIVHGNQEPQSWATITWDNAFSEIEREPFHVPDKVHWGLLANALNTKFESATGRGLTADNLLFIYEKLFRDVASTSDQKEYITWAQFCKDPLPDRTFTFWEWFFAIMKLTKDHLLGIWKKGLIVGFINKAKTTDEVLTMTQPGTFLLRFSDSELGSISIAFKDCDGRVYMLSPFSARDLNIIGLADRVKDLVQLRVVYPLNMNRDDAFGEFYTQRNDERGRDGYVPSKIINVLLRDEDEQMQRQLQRQSPNSQEMSISNLVDVKDSDVDIDMYLNGGKTDDLNCDWDSGYIYN